MFRPWKGVLPVVVGLALVAPASAMAQDTAGPTITIATPTEGATYTQGTPVTASYTCTDASPVNDCVGTVPSGSSLSTSTVGNFVFTVTSHDSAGNASTATRNYSVAAPTGPVEGGTPATLNLTLGAAGAFSPFVPALAKDYTTTMAATILSTADDATLTVADPSTTATGHLVNGTYALAMPLQAGGTSSNENAGVTAPRDVGGSSAPTTLLTYAGPVTNDQATLNFKQSITGTEALRTGTYAKTLTFTLSTTTP